MSLVMKCRQALTASPKFVPDVTANAKSSEPTSLKTQIKSDLIDENLFFNLNEFAEELTVEGRKLTGVLLHNTTQQRFKLSGGYAAQGIGNSGVVVYLRSADITQEIAVDSRIEVNGRDYYVEDARKVQNELLRLELSAVVD